MTWLIIINAFLSTYFVVDAVLHVLGRRKLKSNSTIFHPRFNDIWYQAAVDWLENDEDERTFTDFFADTVELIQYGARS